MNDQYEGPRLGADGLAITGNPECDAMPAGIKRERTLEQYLWLSDREKAHLIQTETEPEEEL